MLRILMQMHLYFSFPHIVTGSKRLAPLKCVQISPFAPPLWRMRKYPLLLPQQGWLQFSLKLGIFWTTTKICEKLYHNETALFRSILEYVVISFIYPKLIGPILQSFLRRAGHLLRGRSLCKSAPALRWSVQVGEKSPRHRSACEWGLN